MHFEKMARDFSLRIIAFLVILVSLWAVVLMVGNAFDWSFLSNRLEDSFYLGGTIAIVLIGALPFLNITSSLTIISKAQSSGELAKPTTKKPLLTMLVAATVLVLLVVVSMWYAERRVYQNLVESAVNKVQTLSEKKQFQSLAKTAKANGSLKEFIAHRDALTYAVDVEGRVYFLLPKVQSETKIYYEVSPWLGHGDEGKSLWEADLNKFRPTAKEKVKFERLISGEIDTFQMPLGNRSLRAFQRQVVDGQEIIILLDTSRQYSK